MIFVFRNVKFFSILALLVFFLVGCGGNTPKEQSIIMATTTSTENSGLLDFLLPVFTQDTGIEVRVVAVGTGQALKLGEDGEADVLLVHAKASEVKFVADGHGVERFDVMYNDFVVIGPKSDPLQLKTLANKDIIKAFEIIKDSASSSFVSRGDDSGTHKKELEIWAAIGYEPQGNWYKSVGSGMGETIQMAEELEGYTLTDRATYLSMKENISLEILVEGDSKLFNQYGVIAVNPNKNSKINNEGANQFINWILSEKGQNLIREFGKEEFGDSLFIPNGK